jgi:hypothetical protein
MSQQHIGSQQGGVFYNAAGNQYIRGDHIATVNNAGVTTEVLAAAQDLRAALEQADLPDALRARAKEEMAAVEEELAAPEPDPPRVAGALQRLTGVLVAAGPLAAAAASLVNPLMTLAKWLGPAGQALLQVLPMVH